LRYSDEANPFSVRVAAKTKKGKKKKAAAKHKMNGGSAGVEMTQEVQETAAQETGDLATPTVSSTSFSEFQRRY
jgi:hypothetical protein